MDKFIEVTVYDESEVVRERRKYGKIINVSKIISIKPFIALFPTEMNTEIYMQDEGIIPVVDTYEYFEEKLLEA